MANVKVHARTLYDQKSYVLAEDFLEDYNILCTPTSNAGDYLAQAIQTAIEDVLMEMKDDGVISEK